MISQPQVGKMHAARLALAGKITDPEEAARIVANFRAPAFVGGLSNRAQLLLSASVLAVTAHSFAHSYGRAA